MLDNNCVFCKIINNEIPTTIIKETNNCIVFKDLNPKSKVHLLVVPKRHITNLIEIDDNTMLEILHTIKETAKELELNSFRIINNCGKGAGQTVFHIHFHLLSGNNLEE